MIPIQEFLSLKKLALDQKVVGEWEHAADPDFVAYVLEKHSELDYQHLRCAMRILQNVNREDVRRFFETYLGHSEIGYSSLARGSLDLQRQRGWFDVPTRTR
ncbi:MAG TPA: hypothetical protein VEK08_11770 [Planctomycetota bacterium]|nr:hypothetical protein [Planctomycetota bacterium]